MNSKTKVDYEKHSIYDFKTYDVSIETKGGCHDLSGIDIFQLCSTIIWKVNQKSKLKTSKAKTNFLLSSWTGKVLPD